MSSTTITTSTSPPTIPLQAEPPSKVDPTSLRGRIRAIVFGTAYGDALGAPVEKLSAQEIRTRYGHVTTLKTDWHRQNDNHTLRKGRVRGHGLITDDTLMTLCLMKVYEERLTHLDAWDMADGMVKEIAWKPRWVPELDRETAVIERLFYTEKWIYTRHQLASCDPRQGGIGNMVNCGAAMYIAPVGAVNAGDPVRAYEEAIALASGHQESYGLEAAGVLAGAVAAAFVPGATIQSVVEIAVGLAKDGTKAAIEAVVKEVPMLKGKTHEEVTDAFHHVLAPFSPMGDNVEHHVGKAGLATPAYRPSRFLSIEELPVALGFALLNDGDFYKSISDGINSGRDTDSIGVMIGVVLGALHGSTVVHDEERNILDTRNKFDLMRAADEFAGAVEAIHHDDASYSKKVEQARASLYRP